MIFQKVGISSHSLKTLIGAIIIKFSTAVITCWGNINLYFLSEFHYQGSKITNQTNSIILILSVPCMVIAMLAATKLCSKFGFEPVIRACCTLFFLSPMVTTLSFNIYVFSIFCILIPGSMYALISVPVLNCVWTHFPQSKNKATAILVVAFGIGGIIWNFLFMHMINPNNQDTYQVKDQQMEFFSQAVARNVKKTSIIGFAITGVLAILGSLLLHRQSGQPQLKQEKQINQIDNEKVAQTASTLHQVNNSAHNLTYKQALKDERFIIIMTISILTGLYQIYLIMNFKIIYMPIIGDDHFLSYSTMVCSLVSIGGAFIWGILGDIKGIYFTILVLSILDFISKIFSDFAMTKPTIIIMVVLIGLISKSMMTLAGPGFVQIFGLKLGTQLLPLKGVAIILGYIIIPLFQLITSKYLDPHQYLICVSFLSIITLICAIRLNCIKQKSVSSCSQQKIIQRKQEMDIKQKIDQNNLQAKIQYNS